MDFPLLCVTVILTAFAVSTTVQAHSSRHELSTDGQSHNLKFRARDVDIPKFNRDTCENNMPQLICNVIPTATYDTSGFVVFTPTWSSPSSCYTEINATISNLTPNQQHGFHVHTYGDLTSEDGGSTGGHFTDPAGSEIEHGLPEDDVRHWGDFGNLEADADGVASYNRIDDVVRLGGIVGRAITIHADSDKGSSSQPSGDSGDRIGYCVIGYKNPETPL